MRIQKLGHCCLVIETNGKRIMTDPGSYTVDSQSKEEKIDLILITHEHPDHLHIESLKEILKNNPDAKIITNNSVGKMLFEAQIKYEVLKNKHTTEVLGIELEAHDCKHEEIFEEMGQVENTAFFINQKLFYPGDSFCNPEKPVDVLALPVAGPWNRVKDFMKYAILIKPRVCFPVHDGMLDPDFGTCHRIPRLVLPTFNIIFREIDGDKAEEF